MNWNVEDALDAQYDAYLAALEADVEPTDDDVDDLTDYWRNR